MQTMLNVPKIILAEHAENNVSNDQREKPDTYRSQTLSIQTVDARSVLQAQTVSKHV